MEFSRPHARQAPPPGLSRAARPRAIRAGLTFLTSLCAWGCTSMPPAQQQMLIEASQQYTQGDITSAQATLDRLVRDYSHTSEISEVYYLRGLCRFISRQPQAAREDFERAVARSGRSDLTARCRASLAAIAFQEGKWERAAELYEEAIGELPDVPPTDEILLAAGMSMQRAGQWQKAAFPFARILNKFRNRPIVADTRKMAAWRHPYYSIQLGAYRDADNAEKAVRSFRQQGFDAVQEYLPRGGESLWVVMAGHYRTLRDAQAALAGARQRHADAVIIP